MKTIDNLIKEKILPNFKNFGYHKRIMFKTPVDDILAGFYFEKIKDHVYLWLFFQPLFLPSENVNFTFGERLKDSQGKAIFKLDEAVLEATINELNKAISLNLNTAKKLENIQEFYKHFKDKNNSFNTSKGLAFTSCYLGKSNCQHELEYIVKEIGSSGNDKPKWMKELLERTQLLLAQTDDERIRSFKEWRNYTLNKLGLSKWSKE